MGPYVFIQDGHRFTLYFCEVLQGGYVWFLFASAFLDTQFGPDRLVEQSAFAAAESMAKKEGMAALLQKLHEELPTSIPAPHAAVAGPLVPTSESPRTLEQIASGVMTRLDELSDAIALLRQRITGISDSQAPSRGNVIPGSASSSSSSDSDAPSWRLTNGRFTLVSPTGVSIPLSKAEQDLMFLLCEASGTAVTFEQARRAAAGGAHGPLKSRGTLSVLITRLRAKCLRYGAELPLHTIRGTGYRFNAYLRVE